MNNYWGNYTTFHIRRLRIISIEVFKSLNSSNPSFMKEMFNVKETSSNLRDSSLMYLPSSAVNQQLIVQNQPLMVSAEEIRTSILK